MSFINRIPKKYLYAALAGAALLIAAALFFFINGGGGSDADNREYGTYVESKLADDVTAYLSGHAAFDDADRAEMADYSVETYNVVLKSGADAITDDHSAALTAMFRDRLEEYGPGLSESDMDALSNGISSYVWQAVLLSLNIYKKGDMDAGYEQEYLKLAESLQAQIDELEEKSMNIHITARLREDETEPGSGTNDAGRETEVAEAVFTRYMNGALTTVNSDLDKKMSEMESDIVRNVENDINRIRSDIASDVADDVNDRMDGIRSEIASEITSELKNSIKNGEDGEDGRDGKNGRDGEDGRDGKSTYIAYADDASGRGFSLTPTETSRYIGTCVTTDSRQPAYSSAYGNWQLYRSYIITSATDENNNTTLYIK
ncbi:MAG: hypothetical protein NC337_05485 [Roseburia sp.]|nr:hypothetical protein [Roseburia sp.]